MTNETNGNPFRGKRKEAVARMHRLAALACEHLPIETLNALSFHLGVYLDAALKTHQFGDDVREELKRERASGGLPRPDLTPADWKLLQQFGIKG